MKITRTSSDIARFKMNEKIANQGCDKCPCCGNKKVKRRFSSTYRETDLSFFKPTNREMKIDKYECEDCGAQWESDPYEWM